eukprot:TRINITY_DN261_c0_g1_i1.p1 TRINITY_DN261_c0_g1~~TRINITY_DN261_c0_g1_i1.p1  ORF type:complete len:286 (-),score=45.23 TRINITY_DN261_c0_g1_i1:180-1037(-)
MSTANSPRVWLITGCSSGFGYELVHALLQRGEKVIATARNINKIEELKTAGAHILQLDVTSSLPQLKDIATEAIKAYGRVDVLVNNAGYVSQGAIEEVSPEETFRQFNTNVFGLMNVTRAFLPHMRERKSGCIVNIGSIGGWRGMAGCGLYCATKFALEGISESLRDEVKHLGIDVILIEPGYFRTSLLHPNDNLSSATSIPDYDPSCARTRQLLSAANNKQAGDPKKGAQRIIDVVTRSGTCANRDIPVRLALGTDAIGAIGDKCKESLNLVQEWKDVTASTDF